MVNFISTNKSLYDKVGFVSDCFGYLRSIIVNMDRGLSICYIPYSIFENDVLRTIIIDRINTFSMKEFILLIKRIRQRIPIFREMFSQEYEYETSFKSRDKLEAKLQKHINTYSTAFPVNYKNNRIMFQYGCNFFDDIKNPLLIPCYAISLYNGNAVYDKDLNSSLFRKVKCISTNIYSGKEIMQKKIMKEFDMIGETILMNENDICNFITKKPE